RQIRLLGADADDGLVTVSGSVFRSACVCSASEASLNFLSRLVRCGAPGPRDFGSWRFESSRPSFEQHERLACSEVRHAGSRCRTSWSPFHVPRLAHCAVAAQCANLGTWKGDQEVRQREPACLTSLQARRSCCSKLGREDSNLQLPKSRGPGAPHRTKRDKKLSDASDAEQTHAERKTDPETVTKPSSASAPRRRI